MKSKKLREALQEMAEEASCRCSCLMMGKRDRRVVGALQLDYV